MNNVKAEKISVPSDSPSAIRRSQPRVSRADDPIRDFFRRGDRGQYEGGPASRIDSIQTLDLPEKQPLVRTPKQEARRRALIRLEAVLLAGCLALLVLAVRAKSIDANNPSRTNATPSEVQRVEQPVSKAPVEVQPMALDAPAPAAPPPPPKATEEPVPNTPALVALPSVQPKAVEVQSTHPRPEAPSAEQRATQPTKPAPVLRETSKSAAAAPARSSASRSAETSYPATPAPVKSLPVPKRAVAAFPDD